MRRRRTPSADLSGDDTQPGTSAASSSRPGLPQHFADVYVYIDNSATRLRANESPYEAKDHGFSPLRRSSRPHRQRFAQLDGAFEEDDQDQQCARGKAASKSQSQAETSPSPRKRKRKRRTRDDPNSEAGSIYAHLKGLPDLFAERNDIMFCGINPGVKSSASGHHFAHRSNHFYPSLHLSGITEQRMLPEQDVEFPTLRPYSLGLTNLAGRPTAEGNELLPREIIAGVPTLLEKVQRWRPRTVCFVGKGISEAFVKGLKQASAIPAKTRSGIKIEAEERGPDLFDIQIPDPVLCAGVSGNSKEGRPNSAFRSAKAKRPLYTKESAKDDTGYGLLPICVSHAKRSNRTPHLDEVTLFFVTPSSSARVTTHFLDDKARILSSLRILVGHLQSTSALDASRHQGVKEEPGQLCADVVMKRVELQVVDVARFGLRLGNIKTEEEPSSFS